ncbi:MAG TPA: NADH-ubiquinone oxidoreductase-F iron-sulfur binding region domain-containing protein [Trebonia sp.]|nr:NADH-ubiquinone oxidoreductase-F iron-sulfur binding region domain-containing protein [Trebonia sp.]
MTRPVAPAAPPGPPGAAGPGRLLPLAPGDGWDLRAHVARHGHPRYQGEALIVAARDAGLTGRGGAAFPAYVKLAAVARARGRKVAVANGAEGEPASAKDAALLRHAPHLVLDGLQLAAEAVGATEAFVYAGAGSAPWVERALAQRDGGVPVALVQAPPRFLAGQESALARRVAGGLALPAYAPERVSERGVHGRPTLVQNVETLAHLALIARHGPGWFRQAGTPAEPGTMLVTLNAGGQQRVAEAELGTPLAGLLPPGTAALIGGYHGTWLPMGTARALTLDNRSLRRHQAALGAGVLAVLPPGACGLAETARVARYLAAESAGQCGPCLNGLPRIAVAMAELAGPRPRPGTVADVRRWAGLVAGRGACHHPDGTVRLVASALAVFGDELARHGAGRCGADGGPALPLPPPGALPRCDEDWR